MARIITIARGIGSGGRTVGKMLSEDMGIKYYDKELIRVSFLTLMITTLLLTEIFSIIRRR